MSDDQFSQIMQRFANIEAAVVESNRLAREANSISRGTAAEVAILYDKFLDLQNEVIELKGMITRH